MADDRPELLLPDAAAWRAWLLAHHSSAAGVWLVLHKKGGDATTLTYADALDEALCFGWIDGQTRRRDAASTLQRMTPRRPRSPWSARCHPLEGARGVAPAGLAVDPTEAERLVECVCVGQGGGVPTLLVQHQPDASCGAVVGVWLVLHKKGGDVTTLT